MIVRRAILKVAPKLIALSETREPNQIIGGDDVYLRRWWLIPRNRLFNVYLHEFRRSDDDRALHDHPWWNLSVLLRGRYVEHTIQAGGVNHLVERQAGDLKFRRAKAAHRIELVDGPCWTLFITGPRLRMWGFHCPNGWRPFAEFVALNPDGTNAGTVGRGCD